MADGELVRLEALETAAELKAELRRLDCALLAALDAADEPADWRN